MIFDLEKQCICLKNKNIFFAISQKEYIHIECNKILIEKLLKIKNYQFNIFSNSLHNFFQDWKKNNMILENEKIKTTINFVYSITNCKNKLENCILCNLCRKIIKIKQLKQHKQICKDTICSFVHVDGRNCEKIKHSQKIHYNFLNKKNINNININVNFKKFEKNFNIQVFENTNEILIYKTKKSISYINLIVEKFSNIYNIYAKNCKCFLNLHNCQCFRNILNNINIELFLKRQNKNVYEALSDLNKTYNSKKSIALINIDEKFGNIKFKIFSLYSSFRPNNFIKVIYISNIYNVCL